MLLIRENIKSIVKTLAYSAILSGIIVLTNPVALADSRLEGYVGYVSGTTGTTFWGQDNKGLVLNISSLSPNKLGGYWKGTYFSLGSPNICTGFEYDIDNKAFLWCTVPLNYNINKVSVNVRRRYGATWNDLKAVRLYVTGETDTDGNPDWSKGNVYDPESFSTDNSVYAQAIPFEFLGARNQYFRLQFDTYAVPASKNGGKTTEGCFLIEQIQFYDDPAPTPMFSKQFNEDGTVSIFSDCGELHLRYHVLDKDLNYLYTSYQNPFDSNANSPRKIIMGEGGEEVEDDPDWRNKVADEGIVYKIVPPGINSNNYLRVEAKSVLPDGTQSASETNTMGRGQLATGCQSVYSETDETSVRYYNLQGNPVDANCKGILIKTQGGKTQKIICR